MQGGRAERLRYVSPWWRRGGGQRRGGGVDVQKVWEVRVEHADDR